MNLILLSPTDLLPGSTTARLIGRRHDHVLEIIKPKLNDVLVVGMENGRVGAGRVVRIDGELLELEVVLTKDPPPKLPVVLCCALMRPIVLKRVLQTAAAMGVETIHLFHSYQVEKSFWQTTALKEDAIREELILGLEQARDTVLPLVVLHKRFKPFVEDALPVILKGRVGMVADPSGENLCPYGLRKPAVVIIGPEGGFIPFEVTKFREADCEVVDLGARILKVETAVVAVLSKIF